MNAKTKDEAIELLDEWGNAEKAFLTRMTDCMFDFRLTDEGRIELANISEYTEGRIMKTCYPNLSEVLATAELDEKGMDHSETGRKQAREGVEQERTRLWDSQQPPKEAETGIGREIQEQLGAASVVINRIVRDAAQKRLKSREGEGKKPN